MRTTVTDSFRALCQCLKTVAHWMRTKREQPQYNIAQEEFDALLLRVVEQTENEGRTEGEQGSNPPKFDTL